MPKLLRKNLWNWVFKMTITSAVCGISVVLVIWFMHWLLEVERDTQPHFNYIGVMCIPYVNFIFANNSLPIMDEHFYLAPHSSVQRKNLFKKFFRMQYFASCLVAVVWSVFVLCYAAVAGMSFHPVKAAFWLAVQLCILYEVLFLGYYLPHFMYAVMAVTSLIVGGAIVCAILDDPALSFVDSILMAVIGASCIVSVLVLCIKHFDKLLDCHSEYETSRKVQRGFRMPDKAGRQG